MTVSKKGNVSWRDLLHACSPAHILVCICISACLCVGTHYVLFVCICDDAVSMQFGNKAAIVPSGKGHDSCFSCLSLRELTWSRRVMYVTASVFVCELERVDELSVSVSMWERDSR